MKVTICPNCRITPDITNTMLKCPKCGRTAVGEKLNDTVTNWNDGKVTEGKAPKVVIKDEEVLKEELKEEIKAPKPAPKKPKTDAPVKRTKRGMK